MPGLIGASEFEHALNAQVLVKPGEDLVVKDGNSTGALTGSRLAVERFAKNTGNGIPMVANKGSNLGVGPAFVFEVVDGRAIHIAQHPFGSSNRAVCARRRAYCWAADF